MDPNHIPEHLRNIMKRAWEADPEATEADLAQLGHGLYYGSAHPQSAVWATILVDMKTMPSREDAKKT
jgi:hypothetical protein